ncbi:zinc finger protein 25 isoform X2 [Eurytemora carolleeae]|uniref:zinc finger protein 25 isoform X2 n=1 Tax=Eurytemora carolleeae TaxID=1294199 RepID=UPI000C75BD32|nr:zinc finger protein 25 isoform X2 [Eurytemora carolleeae]|eukprot:XP_023337615.1 zinc finger protein 25-like isoform X2 [Eurytemora affinis]
MAAGEIALRRNKEAELSVLIELKNMVRNGIGVDLELCCSDGTVPWFSSLLSTVSPFLRSLMVENSSDPGLISVLLPDIQTSDIKLVLNSLLELEDAPLLLAPGEQLDSLQCILNLLSISSLEMVQSKDSTDVQKVDKCLYSRKVKDDDKDGLDNPNDIEDNPSKVEYDEDESMVDESDSPSDPPVDETPVSTPPWRKVGRPKKGFEMDLRNESRFIIPVSGSDGKSTYQCAECSAFFPRKWSMLMHVRSHTKDKPYPCEYPECGARFARQQNLWRHKKTHTKDINTHLQTHYRRRGARILNKIPDNRQMLPSSPVHSLESALKSTSSKEYFSSENDKFNEPGQGLNTTSSVNLNIKINSVEQGNSDSSLICEKQRQDINQLETRFPCTVCGKVLKRRANVDIHMRLHTGDKSYSCDKCACSYFTGSALRNHVLSKHGGIKHEFLCTICGKCFKKKANLESHITIHTGEKKYACPHCEKRFRSHSVYQNHLRFHGGKKEFVCQYCGKAFMQKSHLSRHTATHTGVKKHICPVCFKPFIEPGDVKKHMKTHREESQGIPIIIPKSGVNISLKDENSGIIWSGPGESFQESFI